MTLGVDPPFLEVDGIQRPTLQSDTPLWRPLRRDATGRDVEVVAGLLARLGFLAEGGQVVDSRFRDAVAAFEKTFGWASTREFKPEYVLWLPPAWTGPPVYQVQLGQTVAIDAPLLAQTTSLANASAAPLSGSDFAGFVDGRYQLRVLDGPTVPLAGDGSVPAESLALLAPKIDGVDPRPDTLDGVIELREAMSLQTVPTSAVIAGQNGATCVVLDGGEMRMVTVLGGRNGVSEIAPELPAAASVVSNPPVSAQCP
ncbi:MAG: hypothetical protein QM733_05945 [Ilumatobacteraceae bacterium]